MTDETEALMKAAVLEAVPDFTDEQAERVVERVLNVYIPSSGIKADHWVLADSTRIWKIAKENAS